MKDEGINGYFINTYEINDTETVQCAYWCSKKGYCYSSTSDHTKRISEQSYISALEYHNNW